MNQRIDFTKLGGFPVTQYTLKWMQDSYRNALSGMAGLLGDKAIVSGVASSGGVITDGWISVAGELMPFIGGVPAAGVVILEDFEERYFFDGVNQQVYFKKYATFGSPQDFAFAELKRPGLVPSGGIIMWSGAANQIPEGYLLCDGTNGTPNLSGKFIAGYDPLDADYNAIGNTGGAKSEMLALNQIPDITIPGQTGGDNNDNSNTQRFGGGDKGVSESGFFFNLSVNTGAKVAVDKRPPYYTLAYIMKKY